MITFLFWNLYGRREKNRAARAMRLRDSVARLARSHKLDVLIFTECAILAADLLCSLNGLNIGRYYQVQCRTKQLLIFSRLPQNHWKWDELFAGPRMSIQELAGGALFSILLVAAHFPDRMSSLSEPARDRTIRREVVPNLRQAEAAVNHLRTVLVGDLNMHPYELGVVGMDGLHAVMSVELAERLPTLEGRKGAHCFYNPMWGLFGDRTPGSPGTFYWDKNDEPTNHFWTIYDQVLVRPELIERLGQVKILTHDGGEALVTGTGRPRAARFSDHLPLLFELDI